MDSSPEELRKQLAQALRRIARQDRLLARQEHTIKRLRAELDAARCAGSEGHFAFLPSNLTGTGPGGYPQDSVPVMLRTRP